MSGAIPGVIDEEYLAVTNEQGIFNLEFSKSLFKDDSSYTVKINLDGLQASSSLKTGKEMKDASIFHFKILATKDGQTIETIKNQIFSSLKKTENIKKLSSFFGIQGISLLVVLISISALLGLSYYRTKQKRAQDG